MVAAGYGGGPDPLQRGRRHPRRGTAHHHRAGPRSNRTLDRICGRHHVVRQQPGLDQSRRGPSGPRPTQPSLRCRPTRPTRSARARTAGRPHGNPWEVPYTITHYSIQYWSSTTTPPGFSATNPCTLYGPQQWTLTISNGNYTTQTSTVIYDPEVPASSSTIGAAVKLVWLQSPTSGIVGSQVSPQPEIAVEDSNNKIVSSDFSSVTLSISSGPTGGTLSNTCSGVESYGVVPFGDCSLSVAGTYVLLASDSNSGVASATSASFVVSPAPAWPSWSSPPRPKPDWRRRAPIWV